MATACVKSFYQANPTEGVRRSKPHVFSCRIIYHREDSEGSTINQGIRDKVHLPADIGSFGSWNNDPEMLRRLSPPFAAQSQLFLSVNPIHSLEVYLVTLLT